MNGNGSTNSEHTTASAETGYGSPTPEDEVPDNADTNPGSPDPTSGGEENDAQSLSSDEGLGVPEKNFLDTEDASSDGKPGAPRLGGTDEQLRDELATPDSGPDGEGRGDETPLEVPSTEAPLNEGNAGPTSGQRESFSSETDADASGDST